MEGIETLGKLGPGDMRWVAVLFDGLTEEELTEVIGGSLVILLRFRVEYEVPGVGADCDEMLIYIDGKGWEGGRYHTVTNDYRDLI